MSKEQITISRGRLIGEITRFLIFLNDTNDNTKAPFSFRVVNVEKTLFDIKLIQ